MALYNERKLEVLNFVYENDYVTSRMLANALGLKIINSRKLLLKYFRQGLFHRKSEGFGKIYTISEKGKTRLDWLRRTL